MSVYLGLLGMVRKANYAVWLRKDRWYLDEAVALLLDIDPITATEIHEGAPQYDEYRNILNTARRCEGISLEVMLRTSLGGARIVYAVVNPAVFVKWAKGKGYSLPEELAHLSDEPESVENAPVEEKLDSRERTNLLRIIAVLAKEAGLDLSTHQASAQVVMKMGALHGIELAKSQNTIADKLREANELLKSQ